MNQQCNKKQEYFPISEKNKACIGSLSNLS